MRTRFALVFCVVLLPVFAFAKHMAVLETISQNGLLTLQEKLYLTDILRSQAVKVLPAEQNWTIMTRENINVMLPPGKTIEECEGTCLAETGRNIAADFVAQARISQFGTSFAISAELYETAGNKLVSSFNDRAETVEEIEAIIKAQAPDFFKKARDAMQADSLQPSLGTLDLRPSIQERFAQDSITVTIDGKKGLVGNNSLAPGIHEVKIEHPCYDPLVFKAAVDEGRVGTFRDSLKRGLGGLVLNVNQSGKPHPVPVYFDGTKVGMTPFSGKVPLCTKVEVGDADKREEVAVALKWHDVVKVTYEMKVRNDGLKKDEWNEPAKKEAPPQKRIWAGAFVSATYNDFYGTKFGFGNLKSTDDYTLKVDGADDILGGYWGVGANVGITGLYLFTPNIALRADLGVASRRGSGKSDAVVKLYWNDGSRLPEKSYLELEYYVRQINIDVPLALRVVLPMLTYAEFGPMMSFNLYSKTKFSVTDIYGTEEFREHDCFSTFEFAMVGGIGVMRPIGKTMLDVGMRFVLGVTPLSDADDSPRTWQWQFNVAYWFI